MPAKILDGNRIAAKLKESIGSAARELKAVCGTEPGLAVIIVGEDPASSVYVDRKHKACQEAGIYSEILRLPETTTETELLEELDRLNGNPEIHGILVQLPLPRHIHAGRILDRIRPDKDVDGFHPLNAGNLAVGRTGLIPCTPHGVIKLLELSGVPLEGRRAVVIGRSNIVGKPLANLLLERHVTVTVCHSRTSGLADIAREADILVAAVGKPHYVGAAMVKPGATVIDVGINRVDGKLVGDVDFNAVREIAGAITPVPGGVGPLTIAMLLFNTVQAAKLQSAQS